MDITERKRLWREKNAKAAATAVRDADSILSDPDADGADVLWAIKSVLAEKEVRAADGLRTVMFSADGAERIGTDDTGGLFALAIQSDVLVIRLRKQRSHAKNRWHAQLIRDI